MSASAWTPIDETAAKWTPVSEAPKLARDPNANVGPFAKPGEAERVMGEGLTPAQILANSARGPAMAAATVAPMLTGGASLPVQAAVTGLSGAAQSKLEGGSDKEALISGGIGAALPVAGSLLSKVTSHPAFVNLVHQVIPSLMKEDAGALFASIGSDANKVPVSLDNSSDAALKLMDWQKKTQLGPTLNKFLNRITNPKLGPLTYEEGRDFYSLLGNMSADEKLKMAAPIKYQLQTLVSGLKQDIGASAETVGRGADYYKAMGDYAKAARLQEFYEEAKKIGANTLKYAIPTGLAGYGAKTVIDAVTK